MGRTAPTRRVVGLVAGSHFVNHAYLVLLPPILGIVASEFGVSVAAVGLAIGVQNAVAVVLQLPLGHVSDTYSRTVVLGISLVCGAAGAAMTALAPSYEWLLLAQAVLGVGIAGHHPAHYPLLATVSEESTRGRAYSVHAFGGSTGFALPYAATAAVFALGGTWRVAVGVVAAIGGLYGVACLWAFRGVPESVRRPDFEPTTESPSASRLQRVADRARTLLRSPGILGLTLLAFLTSAAGWAIRTYTPQLLSAGYGLGDGPANLLVSGMLVVGASTILLGGALTDRVGPERVMVGGYLALVVVTALLASGLLPVVALAALLVLPMSGTISVSRPARSTLADELSSRRDLGKNFALVTIGISLGGVVAPPVFGWLIELRGVGVAFGVVAVVGLVSLLLTLWLRSLPSRRTAVATAGD